MRTSSVLTTAIVRRRVETSLCEFQGSSGAGWAVARLRLEARRSLQAQ